MPVIDHLLSSGAVRRAIWRFWYPFLTRRLRHDEVLFLNYAFAPEPPPVVPLEPADEPNRACIQLYHHVATQAGLGGKDVLEVSCGHGGGASYLTRTLGPRSYIGLDLNPAGIAFCRRRHRVEGLAFVPGEAEKLPFAAGSFDAVINVEASHCYPSFVRFLAEVARVLRPGGAFLYADFRFRSGIAEWESALAAAPFRVRQTNEINAGVLRGLDQNAARSTELIVRHLPRCLHSLGRDFAGIPGSRIYSALQRNEVSYRSWHLEKARGTAVNSSAGS